MHTVTYNNLTKTANNFSSQSIGCDQNLLKDPQPRCVNWSRYKSWSQFRDASLFHTGQWCPMLFLLFSHTYMLSQTIPLMSRKAFSLISIQVIPPHTLFRHQFAQGWLRQPWFHVQIPNTPISANMYSTVRQYTMTISKTEVVNQMNGTTVLCWHVVLFYIRSDALGQHIIVSYLIFKWYIPIIEARHVDGKYIKRMQLHATYYLEDARERNHWRLGMNWIIQPFAMTSQVMTNPAGLRLSEDIKVSWINPLR